jgi:two-component system sensor histidine kinase UhpB
MIGGNLQTGGTNCTRHAKKPFVPRGITNLLAEDAVEGQQGNCWGYDRQKDELWEACLSEAADQSGVVLANLPAGRTERRTALMIGLVLLGIGVLVVPFGRMQLPESNAGAAVAFSLVFLADLITWFLLISQFKIVRSRALLVLASGYLFTGAMNVPVLLTMWGQFSPTGLLGAGLQTSLWLALANFAGYPFAVFFYAVMKKEP